MRTRQTYDPFGWRLQELADPDISPLRRAELLDELLVAEAEELAAGRRHLTIIHGEPADMAEAEELNDFYDTVEELVDETEWSRLSGGRNFLTVTVAGAGREEWLACIADLVPDHAIERWLIIETASRAVTAH